MPIVSHCCDTCHGHLGVGATHNQGNGIVDPVNVDVPLADGLATGSYSGPGTKQCSNVYCHGPGNVNVADWDGGTGGACGDCHGAAGTGRPDGVNKPGGGNHLTASHVVACSTCHPHDGIDATTIDKDVEAKSMAQIRTWIKSGFLVEHEDFYSFNLEFISGALKLNGVVQEVPQI